jgi:alkanesulfonate monooxygenase SsuD/methylene tetrahydromethanopterin reductase-like flavin-dependent oxidoreductase (luciferase family)
MQPIFRDLAVRKAATETEAIALLESVGLRSSADYLTRFPHELPGGQQRAQALMMQPRLIVADQPLSADVSSRAQILNLPLDIKQAHALVFLLTTHDISVRRAASDRVAVMNPAEAWLRRPPAWTRRGRPARAYPAHADLGRYSDQARVQRVTRSQGPLARLSIIGSGDAPAMRLEALLPLGKLDPGLRAPDVGLDLAAVAADARLLEELGYDGVVIEETKQDPYVVMVLAAQATTRLKVGTAIAMAFPRSPTITALSAWTLQKLSRGRFTLGLGPQVRAHIERRYDMAWSAPGPWMREYVAAVRAIWNRWQNKAPLDFKGPRYAISLMPPSSIPARSNTPTFPFTWPPSTRTCASWQARWRMACARIPSARPSTLPTS